jgi:hypothetical protein
MLADERRELPRVQGSSAGGASAGIRKGQRMKRAVSAVLLGVLFTGCASSNPQPSSVAYPSKGQNADQQMRDSSECQGWAKQHSGFDPAVDAAKGAGVGAAVGAIGGAAVGAAIGAASGAGAGRGAAVGAVVGGVGGGTGGGVYNYSRNKEGYDKAYAACMTGKGYSVR